MQSEPPELIRKLAALANHPNTPPEEAAAARRKLEKMLRDYNLTEEDILSEARTTWLLGGVESHEKDLMLWVMSYVLDTMDLTRFKVEIQKRFKELNFSMFLTSADWVDVTACFYYYRKILRSDRQRIRDEAADLRSEARDKIKRATLLTQSMKKLPEVMRHKYTLYPPTIVAEVEKQIKDGWTPPAEKLTPAEKRRAAKDNAAYHAAKRRASDNATWQKGEHLGGDFALEG
jgi:hypothetical protein